MKKFISVLICICLSLSFTTVLADNQKVDGLHEKLEALRFDKNFTPEQIEEINQHWLNDFNEYFWNDFLPGIKKVGKTRTDNDEDEYKYWLNYNMPDYSNGVLTSLLATNKYIKQYADNGCMHYLFSGSRYWNVLDTTGSVVTAKFRENGEHITDTYAEFGPDFSTILLNKEALDFIYDEQSLQQQLLSHGESSVDDIRIFAYSGTNMYIRCGNNEYVINVYGQYNNLENGKLYKLTELTDDADKILHDRSDLYITPYKSTYETEALALQADGLIQGNENGLDLLKPLTRIEATAILVRAMGFENTSTSETSYFSDIPSDNWGAKYANIACDKGIATGVGDNLFAPNDTITASQFATLILRNTGENPDWQTAINTFVDNGLITSEQAQNMDLFTRGDMAKLIYEAKQNGLL
jgi:hypothetical protein